MVEFTHLLGELAHLLGELAHLLSELNHQSTCLAELCKPPYFTVQASYRGEARVKPSALPTQAGGVVGGPPKKRSILFWSWSLHRGALGTLGASTS